MSCAETSLVYFSDTQSIDLLEVLSSLEMCLCIGEQDAVDDFMEHPQIDIIIKSILKYLLDHM
jgi:hypothetical protein